MVQSVRQRGPRYAQLPLWRDAQRLLVEMELAVRAFPRYHEYTLCAGSVGRAQRSDARLPVVGGGHRVALPTLRC